MEGLQRLNFLIEYLDQNHKLTEELTRDFLQDAKTFLPNLEQAAEAGEWTQVMDTLHRIKANLELFGMEAEKSHIDHLETLNADQQTQLLPAQLPDLLARIKAGMADLQTDLQRLQAQKP